MQKENLVNYWKASRYPSWCFNSNICEFYWT